MDDGISPLLTPKEVAELLKISLQTVYDNRKQLGGFYPAGIRVLRFRHEDIEKIMEGSRNQILRNQIRDEKWYESRGRSVPRLRLRRVSPGQKRDYIKTIKNLVAIAPQFADCKPVADILRKAESQNQPEQKSEKKAS